MRGVSNALYILLLIFIGWTIFYLPSPPVENRGGDSVTPETVKAGGTVTVLRSYRVHREADLTVSRVMVRGDCAKECEVLDLTNSNLVLEPGDYVNVRRDHVIPLRASPGEWTLRFTWHWMDALGRPRTLALVPLRIVVE
jgi:hypothetical protein